MAKTGITYRHRIIRALPLAILFVFLAYIPPLTPFVGCAAAAKSLKSIDKKIKNEKEKAREISKEIKTRKAKVKEAIKKEKTILTKIKEIQDEIKETEKELRYIDKRIVATKSQIMNLSKEIRLIESKIEKRRKYLKQRLKTLYKQQYGDNILILISAMDQQDLVRKSKFISLLAYQDSKVLNKFREEAGELEIKKSGMEELQAGLEQSKEDARRKKTELENNQVRKDRLLATIKSKRSTYEKTIKELEESSRKLQKMIEVLEKQKDRIKIKGKGFSARRGHLPWPVSGNVVIPFGKYRDPKFNITVFKNGIEIKSGTNERPRAVAAGRVVYADWFKGYGLLLIINHGKGYHSLYGNLSEIFNKTGDIINEGTIIGKTGISRLLNEPTLYFEIRYKGKPVNPLKWLKRKNRKTRYK